MNPDLPVRWIFVKAGLFVLLALLAFAILVLQQPTWTTAGCALALGWASARAYYFVFHVVQHWVDPEFRFRGLGHFFTWMRHRRSRHGRRSGVPDGHLGANPGRRVRSGSSPE